MDVIFRGWVTQLAPMLPMIGSMSGVVAGTQDLRQSMGLVALQPFNKAVRARLN